MFRYKTLRHEILLFGFFQNFYLFLSILVRFINFSVQKWGHLLFFFLKCFDLLNFSNFEIKLMNQKRISNPWWYLRMFNWKVNFSVQKVAIYGFFSLIIPPSFHYKNLKHEILLFGFSLKFLFIFEHISSIYQL